MLAQLRGKNSLTRLFLAAGLLLLAALVIASCDNGGSTTPAGPKHYKLGEHVQAGPWVVTVTQVGTNFGLDGVQPAQGDNFLVVYVTFNNTSPQEQTIASGLFSLTDSTGKSANEMKDLSQYSSQQAPSGNSIQGTLVFEVSTANANFILSLALSPSKTYIWNFQIPSFSGPQGTATP
jgi:hypothetical protein